MVWHKRIGLTFGLKALSAAMILGWPIAGYPAPAYQVYVTNEKSGDISVIDGGGTFEVAGTIPVGKRPRGIHVSPDGKTVYVAVSGTAIAGPPQPHAEGSPADANADKGASADKAADGIGIVDVASKKLTGKIIAGSDPEEFSLSRDGTRLYISNEDSKSATVIDIATARVEHTIAVGLEPEGVTTTPDGKFFYVTCEGEGDIFAIDTTTFASVAHFTVEGRPRSVDFLAGSNIGFVPSELLGHVSVIDSARHRVLQVITLPPGSRPMRVRVAPGGKKIYVSNGRAGTISVIDAHTYALLDTIQVGTRPWGIAISPDGKLLYAANGPSNDVSVVDLETDKELARVKAGASPWGVAIVPKSR